MGKKKTRAFTVFMFEFIKNESRVGRKYEKIEYCAVAKPHWDKLSPEAKEAYRKRAEKNKSSTPKLTSHGISISEVERVKREEYERQQKAMHRIKNIVISNYLDGTLSKTPFTFIMANYFVRTSHGVFFPAELALNKFSFRDGVIQKYHTYLNPRTLPLGEASNARKHAESSNHQLKLPPDAMGETRFEKVYDDLLKFLHDGIRSDGPGTNDQQTPQAIPVFVLEDHMEMIKSVLSQLPEQPDTVERDIDVLSMNVLFNELKNVSAPDQRERIPITITNGFLHTVHYDGVRNIACNHHEERGEAVGKCAMSICQRWFFTFCGHVCADILNVPLVAGVHMPDDADVA